MFYATFLLRESSVCFGDHGYHLDLEIEAVQPRHADGGHGRMWRIASGL